MSESRQVAEGQDQDLREQQGGSVVRNQQQLTLSCSSLQTILYLVGGQQLRPLGEIHCMDAGNTRNTDLRKRRTLPEDPGGGGMGCLPRGTVLLRAAEHPAAHLLKTATLEQPAASWVSADQLRSGLTRSLLRQ